MENMRKFVLKVEKAIFQGVQGALQLQKEALLFSDYLAWTENQASGLMRSMYKSFFRLSCVDREPGFRLDAFHGQFLFSYKSQNRSKVHLYRTVGPEPV